MPSLRSATACLLALGLTLAVRADAAEPLATDARAWRAFPDAFGALAAAHLARDASGLIGRNRAWSAMHSQRFQLGAGAALRTALAADRPDAAARAFRAIEAATDTVEPDGSVPSRLPPDVGGRPSAADVASAAAFFLGDACLGLVALDAAAEPDAVAPSARRDAARAALVRATVRLRADVALLHRVDAAAPNRLLFDARTFAACARLTGDVVARSEAERVAVGFVDAALTLQRPDGHFVEAGGHDTSYQGVALRVGEDVLLAGTDHDRLAAALTRAARWLADRIGPEGRIDSRGNARTCDGGESVFGEPKRVAVADVDPCESS